MTTDLPAIKIVCEPPMWALPPERMSYSKLRQIETCPRRWSLMTSEYPHIWAKRGYPDPLFQASVAGRVVHYVVEVIMKRMHRRGSTFFDDGQVIAVMRELGGYSSVIEKSLDDILFQYEDNPRAIESLEVTGRLLHDKIGDIRENVRILLSRTLKGRQPSSPNSNPASGAVGSLGNGMYPEVRLANEEMKWEGIADLIYLSPSECEIRDIKTGAHKEEHAEQLRIYSLLWLYDTHRNPTGRPATKLTISYIDADVDVPLLPPSEIISFKDELIDRTITAKRKTAEHPPEASPCEDNCHHCTVRHLCEAYWNKGTAALPAQDRNTTSLIDVEVRIKGVHGSRSYDAVSVVSNVFPDKTPLIVRFSEKSYNLAEGDRVRILNTKLMKVDDDEDGDQAIISTTRMSEAYLLADL